jgi:hypothetical protein
MNTDVNNNAYICVKLPAQAYVPSFKFALKGGRDQVASLAQLKGWSAFEAPLPYFLFRAVHASQGVFVDVGGNTGFYTLLAAAATPAAQVITFEPDPEVMKILERIFLAIPWTAESLCLRLR